MSKASEFFENLRNPEPMSEELKKQIMGNNIQKIIINPTKIYGFASSRFFQNLESENEKINISLSNGDMIEGFIMNIDDDSIMIQENFDFDSSSWRKIIFFNHIMTINLL